MSTDRIGGSERMWIFPMDSKPDVVFADGGHRYWSTHCRHDHHDACSATELAPGVPRRPAQCKTCSAPCLCHCHAAAVDRAPDDSCTCTKAGPDPACPVHQGRRARGPKPPPLGPGCICDGSGRTCPRHGVVL